jgi:NADP-dependent 3-hydroxy acid dehydrogenase YdfG
VLLTDPLSGLNTNKVYTGARISLDFQNADIHNILRLIGEVSGKNVVVSDSVSGRVTLKLRNVPWDQALDIVLASKNLGMVENGNVIRIDSQDAIRRATPDLSDPSVRVPLAKKMFTPKYSSVAALATELGPPAAAHFLDVRDQSSVDALAAAVDSCDLLVNNAGGAKGLTPIADAEPEEWRWMFETNVLGTVRVTKAFLPKLLTSPAGLVVNVVSIAGRHPYVGGGGYNAAKFGERALTEVLHRELAGTPVRVAEIDPGLVATEFSLVRFDGDAARAAAVYQDVEPLSPADVAEAVRWVASLPARVNIDSLVITTRDQVGPEKVRRR